MSKSPATVKIFKIIDVVSHNPKGLTLSEISRETGVPLSSVFDIVQELVKEEILIIKNGRLKNYVIGPKLYIYGSAYIKSSNLLKISGQYMMDLADKYQMTVFINKVKRDHTVIVYKYEPADAKVLTKLVGDGYRVDQSSAGKIFLAFDEETRKYLNPKYVTEKLEKELEEIKKTNIAISIKEEDDHLVSISCGVFDENINNDISGSYTLTGLYQKNVDYNQIANELKAKVEMIGQIVCNLERS